MESGTFTFNSWVVFCKGLSEVCQFNLQMSKLSQIQFPFHLCYIPSCLLFENTFLLHQFVFKIKFKL